MLIGTVSSAVPWRIFTNASSKWPFLTASVIWSLPSLAQGRKYSPGQEATTTPTYFLGRWVISRSDE